VPSLLTTVLRTPLWLQVLLALGAGAFAGVLLPQAVPWWAWLGDLFLRLIRMLVLPLIFVSLVGGIASLGDIGRLGRIGLRTFGLYLLTTLLAIPVGLLLGALLDPGAGISLSSSAALPTDGSVMPSPLELVPVNPFAAFSSGNTLQVILFSLLLGIGSCMVAERSAPFIAVVDALAAVVYALTDLVIRLAPLGVFALASQITAEHGLELLLPLGKLVLCLYLGCLLHLALNISSLLWFGAGLSPRQFFRGILEAQVVAFSTTTAAGTLPVTMACARHNLGVSREVAGFVLPVGATVNMDGTALYQALAAVFIAQVYGVELDLGAYAGIGVATLIASIGTAAIPAAGLVVLSLVLSSTGLPLEGVALIAGIDRVLDMARTAVNVSGDSAVAAIVARWDGQLDQEVFDAPAE